MSSLPTYEASHEFQTKKKRQQQRQHEEAAKRQKLHHQQQHGRLPPVQQSGQGHPQMRPGPNPPLHAPQPQVAGGPSHHYGKPHGPPAGPSRYPAGANPSGGYGHPTRGQGGAYGSGRYPPQGRGSQYGSGGMPAAGPRGGGGSSYGVGGSNYPPYGASGTGRGSNVNRNQQQYNWQQ